MLKGYNKQSNLNPKDNTLSYLGIPESEKMLHRNEINKTNPVKKRFQAIDSGLHIHGLFFVFLSPPPMLLVYLARCS